MFSPELAKFGVSPLQGFPMAAPESGGLDASPLRDREFSRRQEFRDFHQKVTIILVISEFEYLDAISEIWNSTLHGRTTGSDASAHQVRASNSPWTPRYSIHKMTVFPDISTSHQVGNSVYKRCTTTHPICLRQGKTPQGTSIAQRS